MLNKHGLTLLGLNHRGGHVAISEVVHIHHFLGDFLAVVGGCTHADQCLHAVTTVDVKGLTDALMRALSPDFSSTKAEIIVNARSLAEKDYDIDRYMERLIGIYEEL